MKNEKVTFHIFGRMLLISTNFFEKASDYNLCPNTFIDQIFEFLLNCLTLITDKDRISPYNINTISSREVMRIKKMSIRAILVDPVLNSLS